MMSPLSRWRLFAPVAVLLVTASGCIPPGVAWFPDSSGFVYTGGKDECRLMLFEVGQKKSRALPIKTGVPVWPAVSPDGKQIAVAWIVENADRKNRLVVLVVDRAGKVIHRSRDMEFAGGGGVLQVWWSPRGDKLLVSEEYWARLYDLKTRKLTRLVGPAVTFGTSPIRPDGKAFLLHNWEEEYRLVDWDGKEQAIKPGFAGVVKEDRDERRYMLRLPLHTDSGWDGPVATVTGLGSRFRIDTNRLSLTGEDRKAAQTTDGKQVLRSHTFPGGAVARVVGMPRSFEDRGELRLEVVRPGKVAETLVRKAESFMFFPSPDGKLLAVRWAVALRSLFDAKQADRILVVGAKGNVVADVNVEE